MNADPSQRSNHSTPTSVSGKHSSNLARQTYVVSSFQAKTPIRDSSIVEESILNEGSTLQNQAPTTNSHETSLMGQDATNNSFQHGSNSSNFHDAVNTSTFSYSPTKSNISHTMNDYPEEINKSISGNSQKIGVQSANSGFQQATSGGFVPSHLSPRGISYYQHHQFYHQPPNQHQQFQKNSQQQNHQFHHQQHQIPSTQKQQQSQYNFPSHGSLYSSVNTTIAVSQPNDTMPSLSHHIDVPSRQDILMKQIDRQRQQMFQRMTDGVDKTMNEIKACRSKLDDLTNRITHAEHDIEEKRQYWSEQQHEVEMKALAANNRAIRKAKYMEFDEELDEDDDNLEFSSENMYHNTSLEEENY